MCQIACQTVARRRRHNFHGPQAHHTRGAPRTVDIGGTSIKGALVEVPSAIGLCRAFRRGLARPSCLSVRMPCRGRSRSFLYRRTSPLPLTAPVPDPSPAAADACVAIQSARSSRSRRSCGRAPGVRSCTPFHSCGITSSEGRQMVVFSTAASLDDDSALVLDLAQLSADDIGAVGGKAANLGELIRAGFDVPPGFCITTAAYRQAVRGTTIEDGTSTDAAAARAAVLAAPFPEPVADAVRNAYAHLEPGGGPVAVRSSATAEDLPGASFAGQQDTYLGIAGIDDVLDAVQRCWASLWTDRAVAYRAAQGIDGSGVALAVVVQRMIDAQSAGVLFTADPVTGRRRQAVIDAARGLGEAVVSGAVDPDHFVVDTGNARILDRRRGGPADEREASLTDAQVRALASLGDRVEKAFGSPQDIEWAVDADGHLWLTQSRPITTLYPVPVRGAPLSAGDTRVFF